MGNLKIGLLMVFRPKSDFLNIMISRGFIADCTDYAGLDHLLSTEICPGYIGFDATAKSLHVGSLMQIMMLRWLQKTGGKPITLMGGGTTKIGDPSFRADERPLLNDKQIEENISGIKAEINFTAPRAGDVKHSLADITHAKKMLNFNPTTDFIEGLTEYINWAKSEI